MAILRFMSIILLLFLLFMEQIGLYTNDLNCKTNWHWFFHFDKLECKKSDIKEKIFGFPILNLCVDFYSDKFISSPSTLPITVAYDVTIRRIDDYSADEQLVELSIKPQPPNILKPQLYELKQFMIKVTATKSDEIVGSFDPINNIIIPDSNIFFHECFSEETVKH